MNNLLVDKFSGAKILMKCNGFIIASFVKKKRCPSGQRFFCFYRKTNKNPGVLVNNPFEDNCQGEIVFSSDMDIID